jgi:hypothetical protein
MVCDQVFVLMKIKRGMDLTDMNGGLRGISLSLRERARVRGIKLLKNRTICLLSLPHPVLLPEGEGTFF